MTDADQLIEKRRARQRRRSRYERPRSYVSWVAVLIGLAAGIAGGLYFAWNVSPVAEVNTAPWQLREADRYDYLSGIMLQYNYDGDLSRTISQLVDLRLPGSDPIQAVAEIACDMARSGDVNNPVDLRNVRAMMLFYQTQGKTGCADGLISLDDANSNPSTTDVLILPTSTPRPDPSKTPTPRGTAAPTATSPPFVPTNAPVRSFSLVSGLPTFCDAELAGIIEVRVQDFSGAEIPGQPIKVEWNGGESTFFTGLKPERGPGYADFEMEPGFSYIIEMPGLSERVSTPLVASPCNLEFGGQSVTSYRLVFRAN